MAASPPHHISTEGLAALEAELRALETDACRAIAERIRIEQVPSQAGVASAPEYGSRLNLRGVVGPPESRRSAKQRDDMRIAAPKTVNPWMRQPSNRVAPARTPPMPQVRPSVAAIVPPNHNDDEFYRL